MGSGASARIPEPAGGWESEAQARAAGATDEQIKDYQKEVEANELASLGGKHNIIRILVSMREFGLSKIIERFNATAKNPEEKLHAAIATQTSGYIKTLLLHIIALEDKTAELTSHNSTSGVGAGKTVEKVKMTAEAVHKAIKGWGTDEDALVQELAGNTRSYVANARKLYDKKYGSMIKAIEDDTGGKLENALVGLVMSRPEFDAKLIHDACKGWGTNEAIVSEVLTTRTRAEIEAICKSFKVAYERNLLDVVKAETSGHLQTVYVMLITGKPIPKPTEVKAEETGAKTEGADLQIEGTDMQSEGADAKKPEAERDVAADVEALYNAGEGTFFGTDEEEFIDILTLSTPEYRAALYKAYKDKYHKSLQSVIFSEMNGDYAIALAHLVTPKLTLFTTKLHVALKGHYSALLKKRENEAKEAKKPALQGNA